MNRPGGVTAILIVCFIMAAICLLLGIGVMAGGGFLASMMSQSGQGGSAGAGIFAAVGAFIGIFIIIIGGIWALVAFGLLKMKEWARITAIIMAGIGGALGLLGLLGGMVHFALLATMLRLAMLAFQVFTIVYLLKPEVKAAFQGAQVRAAGA